MGSPLEIIRSTLVTLADFITSLKIFIFLKLFNTLETSNNISVVAISETDRNI
jgi:hypothetical protein